MIDIYFFNKHKRTCVKIEILMALATIKKVSQRRPHIRKCVKFAQKPQMLPGTRSDLENPHTRTLWQRKKVE